MLLETGNLYIRSLEPNDAQTFSRMAKDGSLLDALSTRILMRLVLPILLVRNTEEMVMP